MTEANFNFTADQTAFIPYYVRDYRIKFSTRSFEALYREVIFLNLQRSLAFFTVLVM